MTVPGTKRVRCPQCGANNFPGVAQCWQCHGSLPPPEEPAHHSAAAVPARAWAASPGVPPGQQPARTAISVIVSVAALITVLVLFILGIRFARRLTTPSPQQHTAELNAMKERLLRERGLAPGSAATDPLEERARRELDRLNRELERRRAMPLGPGAFGP